jgi:uncharacterized protein
MTSHAPLIAVLEPLTRADCWDHLASGRVGRIGLLVNGRPEVLPVNYALDGETVLFRTTATSVLNQASLAVVAFEADYVDETTHTGWSVLVQGVARDIGDAIDATSERLRRLASSPGHPTVATAGTTSTRIRSPAVGCGSPPTRSDPTRG